MRRSSTSTSSANRGSRAKSCSTSTPPTRRLHGNQEGRFYHGYYGGYCYLPLYIFSGEQLLCARLRESNQDAAAGAREEVQRIVQQLRQSWPEVTIILRADSGFCREELMSWCERNRVEYVFGLAKNARLLKRIRKPLHKAQRRHAASGKAARVFSEFRYRTLKSWSRKRRVVAKAERLAKGANPRFVVTSLSSAEIQARGLYEDFYCARGEMENRIKEQQLDRLAGTKPARAQCGTIRARLLKIGARVQVRARRVWISMAMGHPARSWFEAAYANLERAEALGG